MYDSLKSFGSRTSEWIDTADVRIIQYSKYERTPAEDRFFAEQIVTQVKDEYGVDIHVNTVMQGLQWKWDVYGRRWQVKFEARIIVGPQPRTQTICQGDDMQEGTHTISIDHVAIGKATIEDNDITKVEIDHMLVNLNKGVTFIVTDPTKPEPYPEPTVPGFYKYKEGAGNVILLMKITQAGRRAFQDWYVVCSDGDMRKRQWGTIARHLTDGNELVKI